MSNQECVNCLYLIHRYGQRHTAQVYNLVATDTIEGQIFLLLEEKLHGIAQTLGRGR